MNSQSMSRIEVDVKKVNELLSRLNDKEARKGIASGLRRSIIIIRKQAQENLIHSVADAEFGKMKNDSSFRALKDEINISVYRNASGARVDLFDRRKKGSRAYMLKWFESGTKERSTRKGSNRGSIKATNFFSNASKSKYKEAESSLERHIIESITKIANKK